MSAVQDHNPKKLSGSVSEHSNERILEFLNNHPTAVLATVGPDCNPHASVIYYAVDAALTVRFITKNRTEKSDNLHLHNRLSMVVYDDITQTIVTMAGAAAEVTDQEDISKVFRCTLRASLHTGANAVPPIAKLNAGEYVAYQFKPDFVHMIAYNEPLTGSGRRMFETAELD
jgi:general stress protein 26